MEHLNFDLRLKFNGLKEGRFSVCCPIDTDETRCLYLTKRERRRFCAAVWRSARGILEIEILLAVRVLFSTRFLLFLSLPKGFARRLDSFFM